MIFSFFIVPDSIFVPDQTVNLSELESEERDIESFKRFNYYFQPPKNKPKIKLNVKDIVVTKKQKVPSDVTSDNCNSSYFSDSFALNGKTALDDRDLNAMNMSTSAAVVSDIISPISSNIYNGVENNSCDTIDGIFSSNNHNNFISGDNRNVYFNNNNINNINNNNVTPHMDNYSHGVIGDALKNGFK